ncbi:MAG: hypothetical protein FJ320_07105 [SAR202 cluster bacterium]|nr:hypothetical protein [SAR202 cluster bacterium]
MYLIRRKVKCKPGKAWEVAGYLTRICRAYESMPQGRDKAVVYIGGAGLPGEANTVYAEWKQERIEPIKQGGVPEAVRTNHAKMAECMDEYTIEFYELATEEKLKARNFL